MDHERIIHILNYLTRATDEEHGVTINNIRDHLANSAGMYDIRYFFQEEAAILSLNHSLSYNTTPLYLFCFCRAEKSSALF